MTKKDDSNEIAKESQRQSPEVRNDLQSDKGHHAQSNFSFALGPFLSGINAVESAIKVWAQRFCDDHKDQIEAIDDGIKKGVQWIREHKPQIETMFRASELIEAHPKIGELTKNIKGDGWFLPYSHAIASNVVLQDILHIADLPVDQQLLSIQEWYLEHFYAFANVICDKYPLRAPIIRQAVDAYRSGQHYLTVPIFFAQADGICKERIGKELFRGGNSIYDWCKQFSEPVYLVDLLESILWEPFKEKSPSALNENERPKNDDRLNRHKVLHGECTDYGTQENSLKAFSLLFLIVTLAEPPKKPADKELSSPGGID